MILSDLIFKPDSILFIVGAIPTVDVSLCFINTWDADYSDRASTKFVTMERSITSKIVSELRKRGYTKVTRATVNRLHRDPNTGKLRVDLSVGFESATLVNKKMVTYVSGDIRSSVDDGSLNSIGAEACVPTTSKGNFEFLWITNL